MLQLDITYLVNKVAMFMFRKSVALFNLYRRNKLSFLIENIELFMRL